MFDVEAKAKARVGNGMLELGGISRGRATAVAKIRTRAKARAGG